MCDKQVSRLFDDLPHLVKHHMGRALQLPRTRPPRPRPLRILLHADRQAPPGIGHRGRALMHIPKTDSTRESPLRANETTERARAEALFKKGEQMREGEKAMAEYKAAREAEHAKTARLKALRLARDAAGKKTK